MLHGNFRLAWQAVKAAKWRNLLTMFGVIVGVVAIVTVVSIGQGVKNRIDYQIDSSGQNLIMVRPGDLVTRSSNGEITGVDVQALVTNSNVLSDDDIEAVSNTQNIVSVAPLSLIEGELSYQGKSYESGAVIATNENLDDMLDSNIGFGDFLTADDEGQKFAVIGLNVAEQMFRQNVPIGLTFNFRGEEFVVKGVFKESKNSSLLLGADFNNSIFIPYTTGKVLTQNRLNSYQLLAESQTGVDINRVQADVDANLIASNGGQADFTVLNQQELKQITDSVISRSSQVITIIAIIAIVVGGVGIMNIMLVSVSERRQEIGIRKAVGATNRQILMQFLIEAVLLSMFGSLVGVLAALGVSGLVDVYTTFDTVIEPSLIVLVIIFSVSIGAFFGVTPAVKASRKHPIDALRNE